MLKCYEDSIDDRRCLYPFMVFYNQVNFVTFLMSSLQDIANRKGPDPERIKGMWAAIRTSPFCSNFASDPNRFAREADVLIVTSIVGPGFSIETHFQFFHAFLFNGILFHNDTRHFISRLRYVMRDLSDNAVRQSYLHVQKGTGGTAEYTAILRDFTSVRSMMLLNLRGHRIRHRETKLCLEQTQARVRTERADTVGYHDTLWTEWGDTIDSDFTALPEMAEEVCKPLRALFRKFTRKNQVRR